MAEYADYIDVSLNDGVALVRLVRSEKSNALDLKMFDALIAVGEEIRNNEAVRAVVLTGSGNGFCAGIDKSLLGSMGEGKIGDVDNLVARTNGPCNRFQYATYVWRAMPAPVIAAVHGFAIGGGLELALGADIRYVTPDAKFSVKEVIYGLVPDMGGTVYMRELVRADILRELMYTARSFNGIEAVEYGIATRAMEDPLTYALKVAGEIAGKSPDAMRALKRITNDDEMARLEAGFLAEATEQQALIGTPNQMETVLAQMERRLPVFK